MSEKNISALTKQIEDLTTEKARLEEVMKAKDLELDKLRRNLIEKNEILIQKNEILMEKDELLIKKNEELVKKNQMLIKLEKKKFSKDAKD